MSRAGFVHRRAAARPAPALSTKGLAFVRGRWRALTLQFHQAATACLAGEDYAPHQANLLRGALRRDGVVDLPVEGESGKAARRAFLATAETFLLIDDRERRSRFAAPLVAWCVAIDSLLADQADAEAARGRRCVGEE